jgi:hypothetical protein
MLKWKLWLLCAASVAFVSMGSVAHASFLLCTGEAERTNEANFSAICAGDQAAYADVWVIFHAWGDQIAPHVTDHFDCPGEMRMQCGLRSSLEESYACMGENGPFPPDVDDARYSWISVWCGCYAPDEDCHG